MAARKTLVDGTPVLLINLGDIINEHLRREAVDEDTLMAALQEYGLNNFNKVELAVLEVEGSISMVPVVSTHAKKVVKPKSGL